TGIDRRLRAIPECDRPPADCRRGDRRRAVAFAVVAHRAAKQFVDWQPERLALDVPQREVHGAQGVRLFAPGRIEPRDEHLLPDRLDLEGILANQRARALLDRVLRSAFTNPGDPEIGLDGTDHVALIEERIERRWREDPDARNLPARE